MSKHLFFVAVIFLSGIRLEVIGQTPVYDRHVFNQRERMVFVKWKDFTPKVWWIVHSKYRKKDQRVLGPKGPYLFHQAAIAQQNKQDELYQESTSTIRNKAVVEDVNNQGNAADVVYSLYYQEAFKKLQERVEIVLANQKADVLAFLLTHKHLEWYNTEKGIIDDRITSIHSSYMDRGSRILAYQRIETDFAKLTDRFTNVVRIAKGTVNAPLKPEDGKKDPFENYKGKEKSDQKIAGEILSDFKF